MTENIALDLGYRYVDAGEFEFNKTVNQSVNQSVKFKTTSDLASNDYSLGIRYNF